MKKILKNTVVIFLISQVSGCAYFSSSQISLKDTNYESTLRFPASDKQSCSQLLLTFYEKQDEDRMISRIKATKEDPHKFFRSFPPLYYKILEDLSLGNVFGDLVKHKGVIGGDVHIENFSVRTFKGEHRLLINDFDDLSEGPMIFDVIRLLTSIRLSGQKVDESFVAKFMTRYKEGLKGKKENYSDVTMRFFKESKKSDSRISTSKINVKKKKFVKKREPSFDMTSEEIESWKELIVPNGKLVDQYKYVKESGGSGGLDRFELLIENNGQLIWVEAKEWEVPGINAGLKTKPPTYVKRLEHVLKYDQPDLPSFTIKYNDKIFFIREINESHVGLTIDGLSKKEKKEMFLDEAYALGFFHRQFGSTDSYIDELKKASDEAISEHVEKIKDEVKDYVK
ncbi:MAG: DUF2252 family protein [Bacteriovoracaceae bacterium]|nr:DUF2252 family protein [Bacteriovoracaceae bacterium]